MIAVVNGRVGVVEMEVARRKGEPTGVQVGDVASRRCLSSL